jgi:hypothetical protein
MAEARAATAADTRSSAMGLRVTPSGCTIYAPKKSAKYSIRG